MRRKPNLETRMVNCAHLTIPDPSIYRGKWLTENGFRELHIELGCGKGRFTVETAMAAPEVFFVALEKSENVLITALEHAVREGLQNVRFMNAFAEDILDYFAHGEVSRIYINFCDPWPANRHAKRRLTGQAFLMLYGRILRAGGEIHLKTDDLPLFEFSLREFERCGYELLEENRDLHKSGPVGVMTDFEMKFYDQGVAIYQCICRKSGDPMHANVS